MRIPIPSGAASICVISVGANERKGFSIQNVSAADIYISDDQRQLDSVDSTNQPLVGHLFGANQPLPVVYPICSAFKLYARTRGVGAQLEVIPYAVDAQC